MDTFTKAYLAPTMPEKSCLPSIGSVAYNHSAARREAEEPQNSDFRNFQNRARTNPRLADAIAEVYGDLGHDEYLADLAAHQEREDQMVAEKRARRVARLAAIHRYFRARIEAKADKIKSLMGKVKGLQICQ